MIYQAFSEEKIYSVRVDTKCIRKKSSKSINLSLNKRFIGLGFIGESGRKRVSKTIFRKMNDLKL